MTTPEQGASAHAAPALDLGWRRRRARLVLQTEAAECGLACLAMVASAHGLDTDLPSLRRRFSVSLKGMTLADLSHVADAIGFAPRAVRAELEEMVQLVCPCILHWDLNHFVVLVGCRGGIATIHDPARGVVRRPIAALSPHFTGVALELVPAPGYAPRTERQRLGLRQLFGRVTGLKRALGQVLLLALALEILVLLSPFLLQWVVDDVLVSGDRDLLLTLGVGFGLLVILQAGTAALRSWAVLHLSATLKLQWLGNVFAHLLQLPLEWFERRHTGDIWSRFAAVGEIQKTLTTSFVEALIDGALVLLTLVMMCAYSLALAGVAASAVTLYAALRWMAYGRMREASEEALVHEAKKSSHFLESLRGVGAIKLFNAQVARQSRFMNLVVDTMNAELGVRKLELVLGVAHRLLFGLERVAIVWLGALAVLDQVLSVGMLLAFIAYKEQFSLRMSALIDKAAELYMLKLQGERLADIVLAAPEATGAGGLGWGADGRAGDVGVIEGRIELRDVHFRYADAEPEVLSGVSLLIEPGESVALVGPSGCGKTTLIKLLLGIHSPQSGQMLIDGVPLARRGLRAWRSAVGTVLQDEPLFAGSIGDNIAFFDADADPSWVRDCAQMASVHDEIEAMPMGYHTLVGDMGTVLSGGQRQRILLARALYKRPRVLLLDEATSALDVDRERLVNHAVRRLDLTRVIVAHRPETIASAGRVIVLHDGRIAQDLRSLQTAN